MEVLAQAAEAAGSSSSAETVLFWVFAVMGVGSGIAMITMRNIVHAALMLVVNLLAVAALYVALQSQFLGVIQVIVYAGAIMVLFLFVIMLLGVDTDDLLVDVHRWHVVGAVVLTVLVAGGLVFGFSNALGADSACGPQAPAEVTDTAAMRCAGLDQAIADADNGSVGLLADRMFNRYTFPFEAAALLLVVATIGALVLGRRGDEDDEPDPAWAPSGPVPDEDDVATAEADAEDLLDDLEEEEADELLAEDPDRGSERSDADGLPPTGEISDADIASPGGGESGPESERGRDGGGI